jgi:hypothetical protein
MFGQQFKPRAGMTVVSNLIISNAIIESHNHRNATTLAKCLLFKKIPSIINMKAKNRIFKISK